MKPLHCSNSKRSVIRGAPKKHFYAICCSLRNNIYLPNTVMSPKVGNYLKDVYNSQPSLQLGRVLKLVPGNRIWVGVSCLLTASWLESLCWFQSSLSPSSIWPCGPDGRTSTMRAKTSCQSTWSEKSSFVMWSPWDVGVFLHKLCLYEYTPYWC